MVKNPWAFIMLINPKNRRVRMVALVNDFFITMISKINIPQTQKQKNNNQIYEIIKTKNNGD